MADFMPLLTELGVIDRAQVYKQVAPNGAFNPRCADRLFNKANPSHKWEETAQSNSWRLARRE